MKKTIKTTSTTAPGQIAPFLWWALWGSLAATLLLQQFPEVVEKYFSTGIYPYIGYLLRMLFGWVPFSMGDLLIAFLIFMLLLKIKSALLLCWKRRFTWYLLLQKFKQGLFFLVATYIVFHILWGFNYYRKGSAELLQLKPDAYTTAEVHTLLSVLNTRLQNLALDSVKIYKSQTSLRRQLSQNAVQAYRASALQYPFMAFRHPSLKPNLLGPLQSFTGYGGYLFPFTGEAQVDFYVPSFVLPYTVTHEMAHQQGFGSESEANLIGYLACKASSNVAFRYSAYLQLQSYALQELWQRDSVQAKNFLHQIPAMVQKDKRILRSYYAARQNGFQPMLDWVYNGYLLQNNQPEGLLSYNRVVAWLIAFGKKYGWDNI